MDFLTPGEKIRSLRKRFNIRQQELENSGVTRNFISMVESNKRRLNKETAKNISDIFMEKAAERGVQLDLDEEYFIATPQDDARKYCLKRLEEKLNLEEVQQLEDIAKKYELEDVIPSINLAKADIFHSEKKIDEAFTAYYSALEGYITIGQDSKKPYIYNRLGKCRADKLDNLEALSYFLRAYEYAKLLEDKTVAKKTLFNIARCYKKMKKIDEALKYISEHMEYIDPKENFKEYINAIILKANCYIDLEEYNKAVELYGGVTDLFTDTEDPLLGFIYNNLGIVYLNMGNLRKALDCFNRSQAIRETNDKDMLSHTLIDKSKIFIEQELYDEATESINKGLSLAEQYNDGEYQVIAYDLLEQICNLTSNTSELEKIYMNKIAVLNDGRNKDELLKTYIKLSLLGINNGQTEKYKDYLVKAVSL